MEDARYKKSTRAIKDALLELLAKKQLTSISMSELAREAHVSRSTLYLHFNNIQEVYERLVYDFFSTLRPLVTHLHCNDCIDQDRNPRPFCIALREAGDYLPLVRDARFLATMFALLESGEYGEENLTTYYKLGLDNAQAHALFRFQMSGCYSVALSSKDSVDWPRIQQTLDTFIRAGLNALRTGQ